MNYIVEISKVLGDDTTLYLEADGEPIDSLFAIVSIEHGASIVDNGYRSIEEAKSCWPDAIPPRPYHLTPEAIASNFTIAGKEPDKKL